MKTIIKTTGFSLLFLIFSVVTFAQEKKDQIKEINGVNVTAPRFTGNETLLTLLNETQFGSFNDYLMKNFQYPERRKDEGTEVVSFVITPKGELTDFLIINSVSPAIDEEIVRVLKTTNGLWKPGLNNGVPVAMEKEISIVVKYADSPDEIDATTNFVNLAKHYFDRGNKQFFVKEINKRALKNYDKAIRYLPNDKALLVTRGMCLYELGNIDGACLDWNRIKTLDGFEGDAYLDNFCIFKGYAEMLNTLQEKK
ncbi:MAG: energy transducer TonB [Prolixibacteraceae bacterium]